MRLLQNVRDGETYPMPEWDQWGEDLTRGFKLVYSHTCLDIASPHPGHPTLHWRCDGQRYTTMAPQFIGSMILICGGCLNYYLWAAACPRLTWHQHRLC